VNAADSSDDRNPLSDQLGSKGWQPIVRKFCSSIPDRDVVPVGVTFRLETSEKRGGEFFGFVARSGAQETDRRQIGWSRTSPARVLSEYCSEHPQEIATSDSEHDRSLSEAMQGKPPSGMEYGGRDG
jgi:hypothetical protein